MNHNPTALILNRSLILTCLLTGVAILAPFLHSQLITGTLVNATLFSAVLLVNFPAAVLVALIPSLIAVSVGTLPAAMAPMVPYIMISNIILAGVFAFLRHANYWFAAIIASFAKFIFLAISATIILQTLTHGKIALALTSMMGWPQLITALLGALLTGILFVRKSIKKL